MGSAYAADGGRQANIDRLKAALDGLDLSDADMSTLMWLSRWEPSTVATIAGWIERARALAPADSIVLDEPAELGLSWDDGGDLLKLTGGDTLMLTPRGVDEWEMGATEAREMAAQLGAMANVLDERAAEQQAGEAR